MLESSKKIILINHRDHAMSREWYNMSGEAMEWISGQDQLGRVQTLA